MQTPFEMAWLILKQNQTSDIQPAALNDRGLTYLEEGQKHSTTPTVLNYLKDKSRQFRGEPPSESYSDKIKRLMAEEEARNTYDKMPPAANISDLDLGLGQPSSPPSPSV